jgi:dTMP kinase
MRTKGIFITFEGGEGAGKSTQIARLAARFRENGDRVRLVREPGGTEFGEEARRILKRAPYGAALSERAELLLFAASRAQLVHDVIRPALAAGEIVLCDRFADSSLAYQGAGRGLPMDEIVALNRFATEGLRPCLTFLLDLPAADGLARARSRAPGIGEAGRGDAGGEGADSRQAGRFADRMEAQPPEFYEKVRAAYLHLAALEPERFVRVDAMPAPDVIAGRIWEVVTSRLGGV